MKIDIIVCFCDKDVHCIDHFLECIKRLSFDYELTVMDNRKDTSVDLSSKFTGYNYIIPPSYDGLFESRRYGFNHTHNDFVWYVDIDDEIFDFKLNIQPTDDVVFYNFKLNDLNTNEIHDQRVCKFDRLYRIDGTQKMIAYIDQFFMHSGIWNKIFNRKTLQKCYESIPFLDNFFVYEDIYLEKHFAYFGLRYRTDTQYIYQWNMTKMYRMDDENMLPFVEKFYQLAVNPTIKKDFRKRLDRIYINQESKKASKEASENYTYQTKAY